MFTSDEKISFIPNKDRTVEESANTEEVIESTEDPVNTEEVT